jgi:hypothetical protein
MKITTKLWIGIGLLTVLCPLGLLLPEHFRAGAAWGEWGEGEIQKLTGYIPEGLKKLASLWSAPIPDYAFKGWGERGLSDLSFAYLLSAVAGIGVTVLVVVLIGKALTRKDK